MDPKVAVTLLSLLFLPGCAMNVPKTGSLCTAGPIVLDKHDALTRGTAEQVVALNESGAVICGWRAP